MRAYNMLKSTYTVEGYIQIATDINERFIPNDSLARAASIMIFGNDSLVSMMGLAVPLCKLLSEELNLEQE